MIQGVENQLALVFCLDGFSLYQFRWIFVFLHFWLAILVFIFYFVFFFLLKSTEEQKCHKNLCL